METTVVCDRCHRSVEGTRSADFTGGFYDTTGYWSKYSDSGERVICDACMWADERYQNDYGVRATVEEG